MAIRVSIIVQFKVSDPVAALHQVSNHDKRLYSDVQLAARRSLASMTLEQILTNRNQFSEDILHEVKGIAASYGITILRADVKDLVFPDNLQEIMNKVRAVGPEIGVNNRDERFASDRPWLTSREASAYHRSDYAYLTPGTTGWAKWSVVAPLTGTSALPAMGNNRLLHSEPNGGHRTG